MPSVRVTALVCAIGLTSLGLGAATAEVGRSSRLVLALAVAALSVTIAVVAATGPRTLASLALVGAAATLGMNGVRITSFMSAADAFLVVAALGLLLDTASWRRLDVSGARLQAVGFLLIVTGGVLGSIFAGDAIASLAVLLRLVVASALVVLLFLLWRPRVIELRRVAWAWVASASATSAVALVADSGPYDRPLGLTTHPNHLGLVCVLAMGPAIALTASSAGARRVAGLHACVVITAGVVASGSRAALVGYLAVLIVAFAAGRRASLLRAAPRVRAVVALLASGGAVVVALMIIGIIELPAANAVDRLAGRAPGVRESDAGREVLLREGLARARAHPITGSGFEGALSAHNIYLQVWAAAGALGLAGFLAIIGASIAPLRAHAARTVGRGDPSLAALGLGFGASLVGFAVAGFFQNALWDRYIWLTPAVLAAVAALARHLEPAVATPRADPGALSEERSGALKPLRA
jgi:O-antigen ligase